MWRADDEILDRQVAVKEMRIDGLDAEDARTRRERTLREARATARIDHPHVVRVYDVVDEGERLWIVMELVSGRSLERIMAEDGPLGSRETALLGLGLVEALRQVHERGVLHRDIKPGNVLVENAGRFSNGPRVVLTDFGIAAIQDAKALTMVGMLVGSPDYMAPERVSGRPQGPPSDVWSLGATLCAAMGGRSPFSRDTTLATLHAVLYEEPELPSEAGPLRDILATLLEKDPEARPGLEDLEASLRPLAFPRPTPTVSVAGGVGSGAELRSGPESESESEPEPESVVEVEPEPVPGALEAAHAADVSDAVPSHPSHASHPSLPPAPQEETLPAPQDEPPAPLSGKTRSLRTVPDPRRLPAPTAEPEAGAALTPGVLPPANASTEAASERRSETRSETPSGNSSANSSCGSAGNSAGVLARRAGSGSGAGSGAGSGSGAAAVAGAASGGGAAFAAGSGAVSGAGVSPARTEAKTEGRSSPTPGPVPAPPRGPTATPTAASGPAAVSGLAPVPGPAPAGSPAPAPTHGPAAGPVTVTVTGTAPARPHPLTMPPGELPGPAVPAVAPRRGRRRAGLIAAVGVVTAGAVVAIVLAATSGSPDDDTAAGPAPSSSVSPPTSPGTSSGSPTPTVEGTSRPKSLPPGAHREAGGFAWATPEGWRRDVKTGAEVHYTSPDGKQELAAKSALARGDLMETWETSEQNAHQGQDYRKIRLEETTFRGHPAVVWEYTFTLKGVHWHARLLGFNANGKSYQIHTWYQPDVETQALKTYDRVRDSFTVL